MHGGTLPIWPFVVSTRIMIPMKILNEIDEHCILYSILPL